MTETASLKSHSELSNNKSLCVKEISTLQNTLFTSQVYSLGNFQPNMSGGVHIGVYVAMVT